MDALYISLNTYDQLLCQVLSANGYPVVYILDTGEKRFDWMTTLTLKHVLYITYTPI